MPWEISETGVNERPPQRVFSTPNSDDLRKDVRRQGTPHARKPTSPAKFGRSLAIGIRALLKKLDIDPIIDERLKPNYFL